MCHRAKVVVTTSIRARERTDKYKTDSTQEIPWLSGNLSVQATKCRVAKAM